MNWFVWLEYFILSKEERAEKKIVLQLKMFYRTVLWSLFIKKIKWFRTQGGSITNFDQKGVEQLICDILFKPPFIGL